MYFCFKYYWFTIFFYFLFSSSFSISFKEIFNCNFKFFVFHNTKFNCSGWCNRNTGVWLMRPNWIPILPAYRASDRDWTDNLLITNQLLYHWATEALFYFFGIKVARWRSLLTLIKQVGRQLIYLSITQSQVCLRQKFSASSLVRKWVTLIQLWSHLVTSQYTGKILDKIHNISFIAIYMFIKSFPNI